MKKSEQLNPQIEVTKDGPYLVRGGLPLSEQLIVTNAEGESLDYAEGKKYPAQPQYALCRCGQSRGKPFCDGTHAKVHFDGTETASRQPYLEQAETIEGPTMLLTDAESLCAFARFCDPKGRIWNLVAQTDTPEARRLVEYEAGHCPAGRLVAWDRKTGKAIEPKFEPSLGRPLIRQTISTGGSDELEIYPAPGHSPDSVLITSPARSFLSAIYGCGKSNGCRNFRFSHG